MNKTYWMGQLLALSTAANVNAGLAITEIMSSATTNLGPAAVVANSDWWELTNFGTNRVDLTGYKWNDNQGGLIGADPTPFAGLSLAAGESIVFFQSNSPASMDPAQFQQWWGPSLNAGVRSLAYLGNGLSSTGDGIRLWGPDAMGDSDWVDSVDFDVAIRGVTFVYNRITGRFDSFATNGVDGAFKAATADDFGSPGTTSGPVPVQIEQHPANLSVNPGDTAMFTVLARGLPRPTYRWYFGETLLPEARSSTLWVSNTSPSSVGSYRVLVDNGGQPVTSNPASLALNAAPEPPVFVISPANRNAFVQQTVTFASLASGVPQPSYQWFFNGTALPNATEATFTRSAVELSDVGSYTVVASNALGTATHEGTLTVTRRPRLAITEIMPAPNTNGPVRGHNDWWELTNLDEFTVDLTGYRFDDGSALLAASIVFTNGLSLRPGESMVFVENMTPQEFRSWWGDANLGTNVQIVTYRGGGLSLSSLGDAINVWNSSAREDFDTVASEVFSTATNGVSFAYDAEASAFGLLSRAGFNGAWAAHENGDVGSPGFLRNRPEPRIVDFALQSGTCQIGWTAQPGRTYAVQSSAAGVAGPWTSVHSGVAVGAISTHAFAAPSGTTLFRIVLDP